MDLLDRGHNNTDREKFDLDKTMQSIFENHTIVIPTAEIVSVSLFDKEDFKAINDSSDNF